MCSIFNHFEIESDEEERLKRAARILERSRNDINGNSLHCVIEGEEISIFISPVRRNPYVELGER